MEVTYNISEKSVTICIVPAYKDAAYFQSQSFYFIKELIQHFYIDKLKQNETTLNISYFDANGDQSEINEQKDYVDFLEKSFDNLHLYVNICADQEVQAFPEYDAIELIVHDFIKCSSCKMTPIIGYRYKCIQCPYYDLCEGCELKHEHPAHMMLRLKTTFPLIKNDSFIVHDGITCNGCGVGPIIGYRYCCMECPNYNLCQNCEMQDKHLKHTMIRLQKCVRHDPNDHNDCMMQHLNIKCSICKAQPIIGYRYKCLQCADFNLCEDCEAERKHPGHMLLRLISSKIDTYDATIRHDAIRCDSCWIEPIVGFRYKCVQCRNFNLCGQCIFRRKHIDHMMLRMPKNSYIHNPDFWLDLIRSAIEERAQNNIDINPALTIEELDKDLKEIMTNERKTPPPTYNSIVLNTSI